MQFSTATLFAFSAAISQALAKVILTNTNWNTVTEGQPFTITWSEANGPVTLLLKDGPSTDLATLATIACKFCNNLAQYYARMFMTDILVSHSRTDWNLVFLDAQWSP